MKDSKGLTFLKNVALPVSNERELVKRKKLTYREEFHGIWFSERDRTYLSGKGVLVFSSGGKLYLLPDAIKYLKVLWNNGFIRSDNFILNPDFQLNEEGKKVLSPLSEFIKSSQQAKFREDCASYCSIVGLKGLPDTLFQHCIRVIPGGTIYEGITFYPILATDCFDNRAAAKVGHFATVKNCTVFVYLDGNTYVSSNSQVPVSLKQHGFEESSWFC